MAGPVWQGTMAGRLGAGLDGFPIFLHWKFHPPIGRGSLLTFVFLQSLHPLWALLLEWCQLLSPPLARELAVAALVHSPPPSRLVVCGDVTPVSHSDWLRAVLGRSHAGNWHRRSGPLGPGYELIFSEKMAQSEDGRRHLLLIQQYSKSILPLDCYFWRKSKSKRDC